MPRDDRGHGRGRPDDVVEIEEMFRQMRGRLPKIGGGIGVLVILALLLWISTGFYTVAPDERGVVMRFGKMVRVTDPGPHLRFPWPFETVLKPKVTEVQRIEVGFRTLDPGPPARYRDVPAEALMLTGDENIVWLEFIVQYRVRPLEAGGYGVENYLFNVKPLTEGLHGTVKEVAEAAMREVVGRHPIDMVLTEGKQEVQVESRELMQSILTIYEAGIEVTAVQLQDVVPPTDEVRNAFKDVASAREDKVRAVQEAEAYVNDLLPKARGEAEAIKAAAEGYAGAKVSEARGQSNRFLSILKQYDLARVVTRDRLYLETMEEVLAAAEKIIVDSKTAQQILPYLPLRSQGAAGLGR